ncbi:extracellular matrix protein 2-like [Apostichopus japonicus]|uniref:extracellular matrix protein 2-like n=1 Tax=Stichopus japonicus TaxID=307972 RepID=UPI003AB62B81
MDSFNLQKVVFHILIIQVVLLTCLVCPTSSECSATYPMLDCSSQMLQEMPNITDKSVTSVNLNMNEIKRISNVHFRGLSKLVTLRLASNLISEIEEESFVDLTEIMNIFLDNNRLTRLESAHFVGLSQLRVIHLARNENLTFDPCLLSQLPNLNSITLEQTKIDLNNDLIYANEECRQRYPMALVEVTGKFGYVSMISTLNIGYIGTTSDAQVLLEFSSLSYLFIFAFPANSFSGVNISSLHLLNNLVLESVPVYPRDFLVTTSVTALQIVNSQFLCLPGEAFVNMPSLQSLVILRNELTSIDRLTFTGAKNLTFINLSHNRLSSLPAGVFDSLGNSTYFPRLVLSGNELNCDCNLGWFQEFLLTDVRYTENPQSRVTVLCHSPVSLAGKSIETVELEQCNSDGESNAISICQRIWQPSASTIVPADSAEPPDYDPKLLYLGITIFGLIVVIIVILAISIYFTSKKLKKNERTDDIARGMNQDEGSLGPRIAPTGSTAAAAVYYTVDDGNNPVYDDAPTLDDLNQLREAESKRQAKSQIPYSFVTVQRAVEENLSIRAADHMDKHDTHGRSSYANAAPRNPSHLNQPKSSSRSNNF